MRFLSFLSLLLFLSSCIEDDIIQDEVDPELRLTQTLDTLGLGDNFQFEATYFNDIGQEEALDISWESLDPSVVNITPAGQATGVNNGTTTINARVNTGEESLVSSTELTVASETVIPVIQSRSGIIATTTFYTLEGAFEIIATDEGLTIEIAEDYEASDSLPGLYLYLTNNPNTVNGSLEIGRVTTFSGSHTYQVPGVGLNDYDYLLYFCKPFNVKVGDGEIL